MGKIGRDVSGRVTKLHIYTMPVQPVESHSHGEINLNGMIYAISVESGGARTKIPKAKRQTQRHYSRHHAHLLSFQTRPVEARRGWIGGVLQNHA